MLQISSVTLDVNQPELVPKNVSTYGPKLARWQEH